MPMGDTGAGTAAGTAPTHCTALGLVGSPPWEGSISSGLGLAAPAPSIPMPWGRAGRKVKQKLEGGAAVPSDARQDGNARGSPRRSEERTPGSCPRLCFTLKSF